MSTVDVDALRSRLWPAAAASTVLALAGFAAIVLITAASAGGLAALNADAVARGDLDTAVLAGDRDAAAIAVRNLGALALLAGGAATAGALTVVGIAIIGIGLGWSGAAVIGALGPIETLSRVAPYVVFELSGVVLAAAAGLLPAVHALLTAMRGRQAVAAAYSAALGRSLALAAVAAALVVVGALIEAAVIGAGGG